MSTIPEARKVPITTRQQHMKARKGKLYFMKQSEASRHV